MSTAIPTNFWLLCKTVTVFEHKMVSGKGSYPTIRAVSCVSLASRCEEWTCYVSRLYLTFVMHLTFDVIGYVTIAIANTVCFLWRTELIDMVEHRILNWWYPYLVRMDGLWGYLNFDSFAMELHNSPFCSTIHYIHHAMQCHTHDWLQMMIDIQWGSFSNHTCTKLGYQSSLCWQVDNMICPYVICLFIIFVSY